MIYIFITNIIMNFHKYIITQLRKFQIIGHYNKHRATVHTMHIFVISYFIVEN